MNTTSYIKSYLNSKNQRYVNFLKTYKKHFLRKRVIFLKAISDSLNNIYDLKIKNEDYKYLLGPWLDEFTKIYILRNFHYKKLKKKIKLNSKKTLLINSDFSDFITNSNNVNFNINFFANLSQNKHSIKKKFIEKQNVITLYSRIKFQIYKYIINFLINNKTTLLINSRFDKLTILKLIILSKFKVLPFFHYSQYDIRPTIKEKKLKRELLFKRLTNSISKVEAKLITECIPSAYLENFKYFYNYSSNIFNKNPKNIFTTTSHLDDEILKFSLLRWGKTSRPNILISQHGGNYSISNQFGLGYHDYEISKKYYTWGYKSRKKDVVSNAQQIFDKVKRYNKNKNLYKRKFLTFVLGPNISIDFQRYVYQNVNYEYIYRNREEFVKKYKKKKQIIFKKYYLKRYPEQDTDNQIIKKINIKKNQLTNKFEIIYNSKILIFDYFSTMFFEIINMNIPFIFILDEKNFYFSSTGIKLIKFLKKNNLIIKKGENAAIFLNKIDNFEKWWNNINKKELNNIKKEIANIRFKNLHFWLQQFKT